MIYTGEISLRTQADGEIIDITAKVQKQLTESGITGGIVTVFVEHSTCGITTVEYEPGLIDDLGKLWEKIAPKTCRMRTMPAGATATDTPTCGLPAGCVIDRAFIDKKLALGTWQQIILVDFDNRPRSRTVVVQVMGE